MKAIVVGAAKPGYAEAIARKLIQNGVSVIGTCDAEYSENAKKLSAEFSEEELQLTEVDLSSRAELARFVASVDGQIDGLIFAQFFFEMENPHKKFDHDIWDKSLAINLTAPNYLIHELMEKMNPDSSIIIITSTEGFRGSYGASAYATTKAAIHNLVKTLANNLGRKKIRINALAAGWIGGEMDTDEIFNKSRSLTPLGRLGKDEEVADAAYYLFSDKASFITGITLPVDGGYLCSDPLSKYEFEDTFGTN
jgi:3-oxoacyl-[acyl-carrier protein] reductase